MDLFLLFSTCIFSINHSGWNRLTSNALILSTIGVWFSRGEGIYILIIEYIYLIFKNKKQRQYFGIIASALLFLNILVFGIVIPSLGIKSGTNRELISPMLQQTGRYVHLFENEVTPYEEKVILDAFSDESYNINSLTFMSELYNPSSSDGMKFSFVWILTQKSQKNITKCGLRWVKSTL